MIVICASNAVMQKYGNQDGPRILNAAALLGDVVDVSGLTNQGIRAALNSLPRTDPVCLIGGYNLVPTFRMPNPSLHEAQEHDREVWTDAPYGARSDREGEIYLPSRAVSRIPDANVNNDAQGFIDLLSRAAAGQASTSVGVFEQAAGEFAGSANLVHQVLQGANPVRLSPPDRQGNPAVPAVISGQGRVHFLLHGSADAPGSAELWGRAGLGKPFHSAVTASELRRSDLQGAVVTFSSCYAALLASRQGDPPRTAENQVALACLAGGAKVVFAPTGANWIDITNPYDSFGAALVAHVWKRLSSGQPAAEALRLAKRDYAQFALNRYGRDGLSYLRKTLLQAQCLGDPMARL